MKKRSLQDLNLIDDFLFSRLMAREKYGEEVGKILIKAITGKDVAHLRVTIQKPMLGADTFYHGIRVDVYLDEADTEVLAGSGQDIYDIEPDQNDNLRDIKALPRRIRFYHSMIDERALESGAHYANLRNVWVIMIMPYDPLGADRIMYTIKRQVVEDHTIPYDDGDRTVLLYTRGQKGEVSRELKQLLKYFEETKQENAVNEALCRIQEMVTDTKLDKEVSKEYMKSWEIEELIARKAREEEQKNTLREKERADAAEERADIEKERADSEKERADSEKERADTEKERADAAEKQLSQLKEEIERLRAAQRA